MTFYHPCPPPKIKSGSGLALAATVTTMRDTTIETVIETSTESEDLIGFIFTAVDLAVV